METWVAFGQGWGDLGHAQGVELPALGSMGALERLDDPINTPKKSHVDQHKESTRKGCVPKVGAHVGPRDVTVDEVHRFIWVHWVHEGACHFDLGVLVHEGVTHPKDMMIHEGDVWSPYKSTRVHNQGRRREKEGIENKSSD
jgi:hypothetical protein